MPQPIPLKDHAKETHMVNRRLVACALFVLVVVAVLVGRLYVLQVVQHDYHSAVSENNRVHVLPIAPGRGLIYDRNGVVLADNKPSFNLTLTRERTGGTPQVLDNLVQVLGLGDEERAGFDKDLRRGRKPFEPVTLMFGLTEEQIALIAVNQFRLPGLDVEAQFIREYPMGAHFAHSVGYVGRINEKEAKALDSTEYRGTQS
ncbi:MAG TPA: penicillin-binding protein 2, partial [Pseudomonas sp.]|nr:penicillin-binding protein 2 [Pseudomonas sp.]